MAFCSQTKKKWSNWVNFFTHGNSTHNLNCMLGVLLFILGILSWIMNKRIIVVGIALGIIITIAFFIGCPNQAIGCLSFDMGR